MGAARDRLITVMYPEGNVSESNSDWVGELVTYRDSAQQKCQLNKKLGNMG